MILYQYNCERCGGFAALRPLADRATATCPGCQQPAGKVIGAPRCKLDPVSGDFPTATWKFEKRHERANLDDLRQLGLRP